MPRLNVDFTLFNACNDRAQKNLNSAAGRLLQAQHLIGELLHNRTFLGGPDAVLTRLEEVANQETTLEYVLQAAASDINAAAQSHQIAVQDLQSQLGKIEDEED